LRVLTTKDQLSGLDGPALERYAALLMSQPQRLVAIAGRGKNQSEENAIVDYTLRHGTLSRRDAKRSTRAGKKINPLWSRRIRRSLESISRARRQRRRLRRKPPLRRSLNEATIGQRIGKAVDRAQMLAGDPGSTMARATAST